MAVVKANAYGHGAVEITRTLIRHGISRVAVASIEEGAQLRHSGITGPIIVLGPLFPEQIADLLAYQLTPVVSDSALLPILAQAAASFPVPYPIHLKVETGMGRLGLSQKELLRLFRDHRFPPTLQLEGLMTHLADADGPSAEKTIEQLSKFQDAIRVVTQAGFRVPLIHAANSAAAVRFPESCFSLVRPGLMLYGYHTLPNAVAAPALKPVLSLQTTVAQLRTVSPGQTISYHGTFQARTTSKIAILPIGYADGVSRHLSNRGYVLVRGRRAPIVGLICMDMMMVDVTAVTEVTVGDEVVLIGRQGSEQITAHEVAQWAGTIPYEVLCAIGPRIPRQYRSD